MRFLRFLAVIVGLHAVPSGAVYLSADGLGQALLFPYYTVRSSAGNAYNTYLSISNTGIAPVVAKVRFREGINSKTVAEFNLYLRGNSTWAGAVVPSVGGAMLVTRERHCTNPVLPSGGLRFTMNFADSIDGAGTGDDRTTEGYVEVIEMGTLSSQTAPLISPTSLGFNCLAVQGTALDRTTLGAPSGMLTGNGTLINVANGLDAAYVAVALASVTSQVFYTHPGESGTDFDSPQVDRWSHLMVDHVAYRLNWDRGVDAVSSVLAVRSLDNDFVLDENTRSKTDWVVTQPTKRFYVSGTTSFAPYTRQFRQSPCEGIYLVGFDREGRSTEGAIGLRPPSQYRLCWSAAAFAVRAAPSGTVIAAGNSDVLGSTNTLGWTASFLDVGNGVVHGGFNVPVDYSSGRVSAELDFASGLTSLLNSSWVDLRTGQTGSGAVAVLGIPAVGFMVRTFENGTLTCGSQRCQGNYASAFPHRRNTGVSRR